LDTKDINKQIGVRLAALMASRSIGRAALAYGIGCTTNKLARFENARSEMTAAELVLAAKTLGVTSSILTGEEKMRGVDKAGA